MHTSSSDEYIAFLPDSLQASPQYPVLAPPHFIILIHIRDLPFPTFASKTY